MKTFFILFVFGCLSTQFNLSRIERNYFTGKETEALEELRIKSFESDKKDALIYLSDYGIGLFHNEQFTSSIKVLKEAEEISNSIKKSVTGEALSFILSDEQSNYVGESFERVLILQYIAFNYLAMNDFESAKRYFRKIEFEQKEMKLIEDKYRQNLLVRYLDSSISMALGNFNDARVQLKNINTLDPTLTNPLSDRLVMASLEKDNQDISKFSNLKDFIYSSKNQNRFSDLTHIILIVSAGKTAKKESRGKIIRDKKFISLFRATADTALLIGNPNVSAVIESFGQAENPIPRYKERDFLSATERNFEVEGIIKGKSTIIFDYSKTAVRSYNDDYDSILSKNMASISVKMLIAAGASMAIAQAIRASTKDPVAQILADVAVSSAVGTLIGYTIKPDLRCLRLPASNYQVISLWLPKGTYSINVGNDQDELQSLKITTNSEKLIVKFLRFYSRSLKEI